MSLRLDLLQASSSGGPPLVLLHGFMGSHADWKPLRKLLAGSYTTLALDLPGHGESADQWRDSSSMPELADRLHHFLAAHLGRQYILLGYSMGGRLALHIALQQGQGLAGLLLLGASPGIEDSQERAQRALWDEQQACAIESDFTEFLERWYSMPMFAELRKSADFDEVLQRRLTQSPAGLAWAMRSFGSGAMQPLWHEMPNLSVRSLFAAGKLDRKYCDIGARLQQASTRSQIAGMPGMQMEIVENCGHAVHLEQPQRLADIVRRFCLTLAEKDQGT